jgi:hypothetical protein
MHAQGNGREARRPSTSTDKLRQAAWDALKGLEATEKLHARMVELQLPQAWLDGWRVDPFGAWQGSLRFVGGGRRFV